MILWFTLGCAVLPSNIPNHKGTITAAELPTLMSVASPDLPLVPWLTMLALGQEDWRDCPAITDTGSQILAEGYDCVDSSGVTWSGLGSAVATGTATVITLEQFGPSGIEGGWIANGSITIMDSGDGFKVETQLQVDSWDGDAQTWWVDTEMGLGEYDSRYYASYYTGTVGLQDWGLADIDADNVVISIVLGCGYADHGGGIIRFTGSNEAELLFESGTAGPPGPVLDTGGTTTTTTTTGDTGPGDTDDTDGGNGGTIPDLDIGDADPLCGTCAVGTIDGETESGCISAARSMSIGVEAPF